MIDGVGEVALILPSDYETLLSAPLEVDTLMDQAANPFCLFDAFPEADLSVEVSNDINLYKVENANDLHGIGGMPTESFAVEVAAGQEVLRFSFVEKSEVVRRDDLTLILNARFSIYDACRIGPVSDFFWHFEFVPGIGVSQLVLPVQLGAYVLEMGHGSRWSMRFGFRSPNSEIRVHYCWFALVTDGKAYVKSCYASQMRLRRTKFKSNQMVDEDLVFFFFVSARLMIGIESIALLLDYLFIALNVTYYFINIVSSLICSYLLSTFLVFVVCDYCIVIMYAIFGDTYYMYLFFYVSCNTW